MSGLTISQKVGESFQAGNVNVEIVAIKGKRVQVRINAPADVSIRRESPRVSGVDKQ